MKKILKATIELPMSNGQSLIAFNKFGTVAIGFKGSEDGWDLPYDCTVDEIWWMIKSDRQKNIRRDEVAKGIITLRMLVEEELKNS